MDTRIEDILALGRPGRETDRARNCVSLALLCADELGDSEFDSCHLLSGLFREGNGVAFHVLNRFAVKQRQLDDGLHSRNRSITGEFQINSDVQVVFAAALAAAREMHHHYIGTEHLLIGAMSETACSAKMLMGFGISPQDVKNEVYNLLGYGPS